MFYQAGGQPREHSWLPNEEGYATTDMESDQLHVPAIFPNFPLSFVRQWHPAKPRTGTSICFTFRFCTVPQSVNSMIFSRLTELHQNKLILRARTLKAYFALIFTLSHPISPVRFN